MAERWIDVPGARLSAEVQDGRRPVVVGLHGLTSSRAGEDVDGDFGWSAVAQAGRALVRYDARGHGRSTGEPDPAAYRWTAFADDLLAVLDVVSPDEPVDGIGVSMGTATLLTAAARAPERFRRLVLVIPPTAWGTRAAQAGTYEAAARFIEQRGLEAYIRGSAGLPGPPVAEAAGSTDVPPDVSEALLPSVLRGAALSDLPSDDALAAVRQPVLLLPWIGDPGHPLATAERLAEVLPDAALEVIRTADDLHGAGRRAARFLDT